MPSPKKQTPTTTEPQAGATVGEKKKPKAKPTVKKPVVQKKKTVEVELRRAMKIGKTLMPAGTKLASVTLEPGIDLNYLVDSVRTDIARQRKEPA